MCKHIQSIKFLATNNKFYFGQSEALFSLFKTMISIYRNPNDLSHQNLVYLAEYEGENLVDACAEAYVYHWDHSIAKKYLLLLPKVISSMEKQESKTNHLLSLKHLMSLFTKMLGSFHRTADGLPFNWDYLRIDTTDCVRFEEEAHLPMFLTVK